MVVIKILNVMGTTNGLNVANVSVAAALEWVLGTTASGFRTLSLRLRFTSWLR